MGAGGASPSVVTLPPIPGPLKQPPVATAPAPKESDLRSLGAMLSDTLGTSPVALAQSAPSPDASPYFLQLAGLPASAPGNVTSGIHLPTSSPTVAPLQSQTAPDLSPYFLQIAGPRATPSAPSLVPVEAPAPEPSPLAASSYGFQPEVVPAFATTPGIFDPHLIKRDFPILQERVHGRPLVWLDNGATTQKPQVVIDRVSLYYERENSNVHRAAHALAARATDAYAAARETVRRFLNAPSPDDIVFVRGATEAINLVAQSWGRRYVGAGDEILLTWLEHHANIVPWQMLASEKGARLRVAPVDDTGQVILDEFERLLGPRTRIVAIPHVSNALGTIVPVADMVQMAHRHGARVLIDGAQSVAHMPVDVQLLDTDFYVFSGHKIFAPMGIGVLFGKADALESMPPWQGGGSMISDVTFEKTKYAPPPARFEAGTGSIADAVGLDAALDYLSAIGLENVDRYEHELRLYAEDGLGEVPGLRMIGTATEKAGVLSFVLDGVRSEDVGAALDQEGIAVRAGHHCAQPILRRFGLESTVRATLALYNTREDVDALVAALERLQAGRPTAR
jgi:cysteine desulfurase/selenocysteine lyase